MRIKAICDRRGLRAHFNDRFNGTNAVSVSY